MKNDESKRRLAEERAARDIEAYAQDINDCGAGYGIIRHARAGLLASDDPHVSEQLDRAQQPDGINPFFDILRAARAGLVQVVSLVPEPSAEPEDLPEGP